MFAQITTIILFQQAHCCNIPTINAHQQIGACKNVNQIVSILQSLTLPHAFDIYIYAASRYSQLIKTNIYNKYDGHKLIKQLTTYLTDNIGLHTKPIGLEQIAKFFDYLIEFVSPKSIEVGLNQVVTLWKTHYDPCDFYDYRKVLDVIMVIHFAKDEEDLDQRLKSLPKNHKSHIWVYLLAAKKRHLFHPYTGCKLMQQLLKNLDKSQWKSMTTYDIDQLIQDLSVVNLDTWWKFVDICRKCSKYGNNVPLEYGKRIGKQFIQKCSDRGYVGDAENIQKDIKDDVLFSFNN